MAVLTRAKLRALVHRCTLAVNSLEFIAESGGMYEYTAGMLFPRDLENVVWLLRFVALSVWGGGTPSGLWVEQETDILVGLISTGYMINHGEDFPYFLRDLLWKFQARRKTFQGIPNACVLPSEASARDWMMRFGFY
jgi:hypothetical protein